VEKNQPRNSAILAPQKLDIASSQPVIALRREKRARLGFKPTEREQILFACIGCIRFVACWMNTESSGNISFRSLINRFASEPYLCAPVRVGVRSIRGRAVVNPVWLLALRAAKSQVLVLPLRGW
jgi:hypothetical protein